MLPQRYFDKLVIVCKGDKNRAWRWLQTSHESLSYESPLQALVKRKDKKVINLIDYMFDNNMRI